MSQEVFEIIKKLNPRALETQIIFQCAPLLCGLKASNLLIVSKENVTDVMNLFHHTYLQIVQLAASDQKATFLIFNQIRLQNHLNLPEVSHLLRKMGYNDLSLSSLIDSVGFLYQEYVAGTGEFPHELGLLLEYPPEDVKAYMIHQGKNALVSGYWKVYHNPEEKKVLFQKFESAKETLLTVFSEGIGLEDIINQKVCISMC